MKILVIGAGPAGLSCALNASREGHEVHVFEKSNTLGSKVCGEALAREALDYVSVKPSKEFIISEVKGFRITFKGQFIRQASFGDLRNVPGYLIDKPAFLDILQNETERQGVKVSFNSRVEKADPSTGKILLQNGETHQGDLVVCADGPGTVARSHLDYSSYETAIGVQYRCPLPEGLDPEYLHLDIIGEGYIWTFIKEDCANIGLGLPSDSHSLQFVKSYLDKYLEKLRIKPLGKALAAPVSIGGPLKSFGTGKLVVAGEAAGCVMPLSGEGIRFGMYGGSIAHKPSYRVHFMKKYGSNLNTSRKILGLVRVLSDEERISFLKCLDDPLEVLEGKRPQLRNFLLRPRLFAKLMRKCL